MLSAVVAACAWGCWRCLLLVFFYNGYVIRMCVCVCIRTRELTWRSARERRRSTCKQEEKESVRLVVISCSYSGNDSVRTTWWEPKGRRRKTVAGLVMW